MSETISVHNMFSLGLSLEFSLNNLLSYCGLVAAKIRVSDKDLPVLECSCTKIYISQVLSKNKMGFGVPYGLFSLPFKSLW